MGLIELPAENDGVCGRRVGRPGRRNRRQLLGRDGHHQTLTIIDVFTNQVNASGSHRAPARRAEPGVA